MNKEIDNKLQRGLALTVKESWELYKYIKALEQTELKSSDDCISRESVIDTIDSWLSCDGYNEAERHIMRAVQSALYNLPSVTPKAEWIPVSERLPEKQGCYLVTIRWKGSYSGDVYIETNMAMYREKSKEWDCADVIAWMPEPPSYQGEEND